MSAYGKVQFTDTETVANETVMQTEINNPTFYINRNFEKKESVSGILGAL